MTTNHQVAQPINPKSIELALIRGDLSGLNPEQRLAYYGSVCELVGLNKLTKPFDYIEFRGKLALYANKNCAEQLRKIHNISITITDKTKIDNLYIITAKAMDRQGRVDESTAAIDLKGLTGEALANALMKCETKAKRRVTLSLCGLGMLDESEVETLPGAKVTVAELDPKPLPAGVVTADQLPAPGTVWKYDANAIAELPEEDRARLRKVMKKHKFSSENGVISSPSEIPELKTFLLGTEEDDLPWAKWQKENGHKAEVV